MKLRITSQLLIACLIAGCNLSKPNAPSEQLTRAPAADTESGSARPITYWRFIWLESGLPEADMIEVFPQAVLDRVESAVLAGDDPAENIRAALQVIIDAPQDRLWETENLTIDAVQVTGSAATIVLSGDIMVFGGGVGAGTRLQIALTIFEEPGVETALITLNGENLANLAIDHESQRQPDDFVYARDVLYTLVAKP